MTRDEFYALRSETEALRRQEGWRWMLPSGVIRNAPQKSNGEPSMDWQRCFSSDEAAQAFIVRRAAEGSEIHQRVLNAALLCRLKVIQP